MNTVPWYVKSFQEDYLKIYAHRTDEAALKEVQSIISILNMKSGSKVLDLCCGNGRHSRQLAKLGFEVTGIDLSSVLLKEAIAKNKNEDVSYIQSDVREVECGEVFDYVLNLFTSFGYFEEADENVKVFQSIHGSLKKNGKFLVDFLNPSYVKEHLVPYSERNVGDLKIVENRRIEGNKVIKDIEVTEDKETRTYTEQVNLFEFEEMKTMLESAGLAVQQIYGDLNQSPYVKSESPRMIIIGKK